ncbi:MAG: response regulator [Deltaproteobacteria bacterium]|nr:response regulator [Deltaproteobacteria bacterium]
MKKALVADDSATDRRIIADILVHEGFSVETAESGAQAMEKSRTVQPEIIILDILLPDIIGYEVCRRLRENSETSHIPVIMVTAAEDKDARIKSLDYGANDFLTKPVDATELKIRTRNLTRLKEYEEFLERHNEELDVEVRKRTAQLRNALVEVTAANQALKESEKTTKESYIDTIHKLTIIAEYKDRDTPFHIIRVGHLSSTLAVALGWPEDEVEAVFYASPMHDIGKVGIPIDILMKPDKLTKEEFALVKTHTTLGADILKDSNSDILKMAEKIARSHHERWDGGGYPTGRKGADIPVEAAIMNIVDQYDALRSRRPYKPPFSHDAAFRILTEGDGRTMPWHFNPALIEAFKACHKKFAEIYEAYTEVEMSVPQTEILPRA